MDIFLFVGNETWCLKSLFNSLETFLLNRNICKLTPLVLMLWVTICVMQHWCICISTWNLRFSKAFSMSRWLVSFLMFSLIFKFSRRPLNPSLEKLPVTQDYVWSNKRSYLYRKLRPSVKIFGIIFAKQQIFISLIGLHFDSGVDLDSWLRKLLICYILNRRYWFRKIITFC